MVPSRVWNAGLKSTPSPGTNLKAAELPRDADLLALALVGDDSAYATLVRRYARAAYIVAHAVVRDPDAAEDVCQDALFRTWQRLHECRDPAKFRTWLLSAVRRHALNAIRDRRSTTTLEEEEGLHATGLTPDRVAERSDLRERLHWALAQLSEPQRQAVLLFDLEGYSHADIATALATTENMSRQLVMLGRRRLANLLSNNREEP